MSTAGLGWATFSGSPVRKLEQPPPQTGSINARLGRVHRLCRFDFGEDAGWQDARLRQRYLHRSLTGYGLGQPRLAQLRLKAPRPSIRL